MDIAGKRVLLTGAAVRVGAALAHRFAAEGAALLLHCHTSREQAEALRSSLLHPEMHQVVSADFAEPGAAGRLFLPCGRVDILINNASLYEADALPEGREERDRRHFEVNYWSPLALMRAFAAQNLPEGAIVNLLDQEIGHAGPTGGGYALSRRCLADATLEFAREAGPRNIRCNGVAPGPVLPPRGLEGQGMVKTVPRLPLRRKVELDDLADAVLFLCRNDSVTGEILFVDCGQHLT